MSAVLVEAGPDKGAIWHFGEPNKEQKELVAGNGWADLSHRAVISISGKDRLTWLHALTTQHLENLSAGDWKDALISLIVLSNDIFNFYFFFKYFTRSSKTDGLLTAK